MGPREDFLVSFWVQQGTIVGFYTTFEASVHVLKITLILHNSG